MSTKKPEPLHPGRKRVPCPVCGEISYSLGGIHPQCAVRQADQKRLNRIKEKQTAAHPPKPPCTLKRWQKICPKCKALMHVRKKVCDCGQMQAINPVATRGVEP